MLRESARYLARAWGWHIFPLKVRSKQPLTRNGLKDATTDRDQIDAWWGKYPEANIGVVTGPSGLVVIDMDDLAASWVLSDKGLVLPPTLMAETSKGVHLYYLATEELRPTVGRLPGVGATPGIDLRAAESYVLAPPSVHPDGPRYRWNTQYATEPQPAPDWLKPDPPVVREEVEVTNPTAYAQGALRKTVARIKEARNGERNHTLNREVFGLRRFIEAGQLDRETVRSECMAAAKAISLGEYEAHRTIASALGERYE